MDERGCVSMASGGCEPPGSTVNPPGSTTGRFTPPARLRIPGGSHLPLALLTQPRSPLLGFVSTASRMAVYSQKKGQRTFNLD
jgi:hypothetical protein